MAAYRVVGQSVPRTDGVEKVTGAARYTADVQLPGTLWARTLRSPLSYARIVGESNSPSGDRESPADLGWASSLSGRGAEI